MSTVYQTMTKYKPDDLCITCKERPPRASGECNRCYSYRCYRGKTRPLDTECINKRLPSRALCATCSERVVRCNKECARCWIYRLKKGVARPIDTVMYKKGPRNPDAKCITCGRQKRGGAKGECKVCYAYRHQTGITRPTNEDGSLLGWRPRLDCPDGMMVQADAARELGISRERVRQLIRAGKLRSVVVGKHEYVYAVDINNRIRCQLRLVPNLTVETIRLLM
jgi:hypothetical protein